MKTKVIKIYETGSADVLKIEENEIDKGIRQRYLNFVVIGGGPTGVELAGSIAEIAFKNINKEFNFTLPASKIEITFKFVLSISLINSDGVRLPSDLVVCKCKSICIGHE